MTETARSARVIGAHLFAQFGYEHALAQISAQRLHSQEVTDDAFWDNVVQILDELAENDRQGLHPCAALPPRRRPPSRRPS